MEVERLNVTRCAHGALLETTSPLPPLSRRLASIAFLADGATASVAAIPHTCFPLSPPAPTTAAAPARYEQPQIAEEDVVTSVAKEGVAGALQKHGLAQVRQRIYFAG